MSSIPSYITSGALSRAHHAFIVRLHQVQLGSGNGSGSEVEELKVVREERERCLGVLKGVGLPGRGLSNVSRGSDVILCAVEQVMALGNLDWAEMGWCKS